MENGGGRGNKPPRLSWREGLYLVGPDPLTSLFYSSGALIAAGVGYTAPAFQIGLYLLLFLLAPLYIEAVLLTLSNGGTYVMTRYALSHLGKLAIIAAALVGIIISFSYVATAIVSMLSYSDYVRSLVGGLSSYQTLASLGLSAIPSIGFGVWVMPHKWRQVVVTVGVTVFVALMLSTVIPPVAVVMFPPLVVLFSLNNEGLKESVQVSKTIFLINMVVMVITIVVALVYLLMHGGQWDHFVDGVALADAETLAATAEHERGVTGHELISELPGFATLGAPLILAGAGASILGASGVESVMNIPEDLARPRSAVRRIYRWMLTLLLVIGGSVSLLLFSVLTPEELATKSSYLVAALGERSVAGVTGSATLGRIWQTVIVANAAFMLIGATNTGFAGARGLWLTMARDSLLPRFFMRKNERGAFGRIHWLMLVSVLLLAMEADWDLSKLERWYGATFGLVMVSGMVAFILLRRFKAHDPRLYRAPFNVSIAGVSVPLGAIVGVVTLGYALLSMYATYRGDITELRTLVTIALVLVGGVLLLYNHRPILRTGYRYFRRVIETVEASTIETEDRTVVVAVGGVRVGRLLQKAIRVARQQSVATGIAYRQLVVFHMTPNVRSEHVYRITPDMVRPADVTGGATRIFNELTQLTPDDMTVYLALVPPPKSEATERTERVKLHQALDALVTFHDRHNFRGHIVMVGTYGVKEQELAALDERLEGSTLVPVPLFGE